MRLPRDLSGRDLARALGKLGYAIDHQTGSHIRLTTQQPSEHHITVPAHDPIKIARSTASCATWANTPNLIERLFSDCCSTPELARMLK